MSSDHDATAAFGIAGRFARAAPALDELDAERVLHRVLEGVLDRSVEPVRVGRYVLLDAVGSGGLGAVYAAYDPELDRKLAIKLIRGDAPQLASGDDLQARLRREAQAMARVTHPNVVTIHDVGSFRDQTFIAMELIDGVTLREWLGQRRAWTEIRDVLVAAGRGLAAVHDAGLVQRDFKPHNVIVARDGAVKLLDFGLARAIAGDGAAASSGVPVDAVGTSLVDVQLTMTGLVAGTPAYMAPEQCRAAVIDARADQFAFCVTAFEALHGQRPFAGRDVSSRLEAIAGGILPARAPGDPTPRWLERAIVRGLAADPAARFSSMHELLAAMQHDARRRRSWALVAAVGVGSALATAAAIRWWPHPADPEQLAMVARMVDEARAAAAEQRFIYPSIDDPRRATAFSTTVALEQLDGPIAELGRSRAAELRHEFAGELVRLGDAYASSPAGIDVAADFYAAAVLFDPEDARALAGSYLTMPELAALRARATELAFAPAELEAAAPLQALAMPEGAPRRAAIAELRRTRGASGALARIDRVGAGEVEAPAPIVTPEPAKAPAPEPPPAPAPSPGARDEADQLIARGLAALRRRQLDEAERLMHRAAAKNPGGAKVLASLSTLYFELGRYPDAVAYGERAVRAAPRSVAARLALGDAYFKVLRYDDARVAYRAAAELGSKDAERRIRRVDDRLGAN